MQSERVLDYQNRGWMMSEYPVKYPETGIRDERSSLRWKNNYSSQFSYVSLEQLDSIPPECFCLMAYDRVIDEAIPCLALSRWTLILRPRMHAIR
jgi:hypothetical protein